MAEFFSLGEERGGWGVAVRRLVLHYISSTDICEPTVYGFKLEIEYVV